MGLVLRVLYGAYLMTRRLVGTVGKIRVQGLRLCGAERRVLRESDGRWAASVGSWGVCVAMVILIDGFVVLCVYMFFWMDFIEEVRVCTFGA
jgi:hypothetical protein